MRGEVADPHPEVVHPVEALLLEEEVPQVEEAHLAEGAPLVEAFHPREEVPPVLAEAVVALVQLLQLL